MFKAKNTAFVLGKNDSCFDRHLTNKLKELSYTYVGLDVSIVI